MLVGIAAARRLPLRLPQLLPWSLRGSYQPIYELAPQHQKNVEHYPGALVNYDVFKWNLVSQALVRHSKIPKYESGTSLTTANNYDPSEVEGENLYNGKQLLQKGQQSLTLRNQPVVDENKPIHDGVLQRLLREVGIKIHPGGSLPTRNLIRPTYNASINNDNPPSVQDTPACEILDKELKNSFLDTFLKATYECAKPGFFVPCPNCRKKKKKKKKPDKGKCKPKKKSKKKKPPCKKKAKGKKGGKK